MKTRIVVFVMLTCLALCSSQDPDLDKLVRDTVNDVDKNTPNITVGQPSRSHPGGAPQRFGSPASAPAAPGTPRRRGSTQLQNLFGRQAIRTPVSARSARGGILVERSLFRLQQSKFKGRSLTLSQVSPLVSKYVQPICEPPPIVCNSSAPYRTADGTCNNLKNVFWGAADTPQRRFVPAQYGDPWNWGFIPRIRGKLGDKLKSPRIISNLIFNGPGLSPPSRRKNTALMTHFGQFVDHDCVKTPIFSESDGANIECCDENTPIARSECFPFMTPPGDFKYTCMNFVRSRPSCFVGRRQQINGITSYLDLSSVYGSSLVEQMALRENGNGAKLKVGDNDILPDGKDTCENDIKCFAAGDTRSSEIPPLTVIHILFVREHNRIVEKLSNRGWDSEKLFQETKKILTGVYQHIVYNEFLPAILGLNFVRAIGLKSRRKGLIDWYTPEFDASTRNSFGAAAYRMGHSLVGNFVGASNKHYEEERTSPLKEEFFDTKTIRDEDEFGTTRIGRWLSSTIGRHLDKFLSPQVRNHLFETGPGMSLDLGALNIQRGRDHGLPGYNSFRKFCGLRPALYFSHKDGGFVHHSRSTVKQFAELYRHVDDVDLFVGGLSERPLDKETILGPTFRCLIALQFLHFKYGDRFFYENKFPTTGFTTAQVNNIKKQTMARILCSTLKLDKIQRNVFFKQNKRQNPFISWDKLCDLDFDLF